MRALLLVLTAVTMTGQQTEPRFKANTTLVYLPTRVQTKVGQTIYGLKAEDFLVEDNGVRRAVRVDEDPAVNGLSLVVVIQCSRSAPSEFPKLNGLGAMLEAIVGAVPHEVAVLAYGEGQHLLGDFSFDPDASRAALSKLGRCGEYGAATVDAVYYAMNMLNQRQNGYRRAIHLISETRDHGSRSKLDEVVAELGVTDTVIYTLAFNPVRDEFQQGFRNPDTSLKSNPKDLDYTEHAPALELPGQIMPLMNALRKNASASLAALSGGESMTFSSQKDLEQKLQRVAGQIHNYYMLSFTPPLDRPLALHALKVRVPSHPGAVIQTRKNYW